LFIYKLRRAQFPFEELVYEPDTYYLFNTQVTAYSHQFSMRPRYLFTLEFAADKDQLSFENSAGTNKNPAF
jgi:hypothetical protein